MSPHPFSTGGAPPADAPADAPADPAPADPPLPAASHAQAVNPLPSGKQVDDDGPFCGQVRVQACVEPARQVGAPPAPAVDEHYS